MLWISEHQQYKEWHSSKATSFLSIIGESGSGMSAISAYMLKTLNIADATILRFTFNKGNIWQTSVKSMVGSLSRQLLLTMPHLHYQILPALSDFQAKEYINFKDISKLLRALLQNSSSSSPIYLIIANIDDCISGPKHVMEVLDSILQVRGSRVSNIKAVVIGREIGNIKPAPRNRYEIRLVEEKSMEEAVEKMIRKYAMALVDMNPYWDEFQESICEKVGINQPNLLLAHHRLRFLTSPDIMSTRSEISNLLNSIPQTITECYRQNIDRKLHSHQLWALTALDWLAHSFRPVKHNEIAIVLAMHVGSLGPRHTGNLTLETLCDYTPWDVAGDIDRIFPGTVQLVRDEIQLTHPSLRDYLIERNLISTAQHGASFHQQMVKTCLEYLDLIRNHESLTQLASDSSSRRKWASYDWSADVALGLLEYAVRYWPRHFEAGFESTLRGQVTSGGKDDGGSSLTNLNPSPDLLGKDLKFDEVPKREYPQVLQNFLNDKDLFDLWSKLCWAFDGYPPATPILDHLSKVAARYDLVNVSTIFLDKRKDIGGLLASPATETSQENEQRHNPDGSDGGVSKPPEAEEGAPKTEEPVSSPAQTDDQHKLELEQALEIACHHGHLNIATLLVTAGITSDKAMFSAAKAGQEEIASFLLQKCESGEIQIDKQNSLELLSLLAGNGMKLATETLLESRSQTWGLGLLEAHELSFLDALKAAIKHGHTDIVKILMPLHGPESAPQNREDRLWYLAAERGFTDIAQMLLEIPGGQVSQGHDSALYAAACNGQLDTVRFFMNLSDYQPKFDSSGEKLTPIEIASSKGHHLVVVEFLNKLRAEQAPLKRRRTVQFEPNSPSIETKLDFKSLKGEDNKSTLEPSQIQTILHSSLRLAASNGHLKVAQSLLDFLKHNLDKDASIISGGGMVEDEEGRNALHLAAARGHEEVVAALLKEGFPVDATAKNRKTALSYGASHSFSNVVDILVQNGAEVTTFDIDGNTPLHFAIESGSVATIRILQDVSNNARLANKDGKTPLSSAVGKASPSLIKQLLNTTAPPPSKSKEQYRPTGSLLIEAARSISSEIVKILVDIGEDCNSKGEDGEYPLSEAAWYGKTSTISILLDNGADINAQNSLGRTALWCAAYRDHLDACKLLIEKGANPNIQSQRLRTPLYEAAASGYYEILQELLKIAPDRIDIDQKNEDGKWTALHVAFNSAKISQALLAAGANPDERDNYGNTPIFWSAQSAENLDVTQVLIDAGAKTQTVNKNGWIASFMAAEGDNIDAFKLLIANSGDVNYKDEWGQTALHVTVFHKSTQVFNYIIEELDVDLNATQRDWGSPLCYAANRGSLEFVDRLLNRGAKLDAYGGEYFSPLQASVVSTQNTEAIVKRILETKPDINVFGGKHGSALLAAISKNDSSIANLLLDQDEIDVNLTREGYTTPVEAAAFANNTEILKRLLEKNADIHYLGGKHISALHAAIEGNGLDAVKLLLDKGVDPQKTEEGKELPIQAACKAGRTDIVRALCEHGARFVPKDPEKPDIKSSAELALESDILSLLVYLFTQIGSNEEQKSLGKAILERAITSGSSKDLQSALEAGVNPNIDIDIKYWPRKTPLITAVINENAAMVKVLLDYNVDTTFEDNRQRNALTWAAHTGNTEIFELLLENLRLKSTPEQFKVGCSGPLHAAIRAQMTSICSKLLDQGVDETIRDQNNWLPIQIAQCYEVDNITDLLKKSALLDSNSTFIVQSSPTHWHEFDKGENLRLSEDKKTVFLDDEGQEGGLQIARANFCIPIEGGNVPEDPGLFYFEITINRKGKFEDGLAGRVISFGFCGEHVKLDSFVGWSLRSWGIHSDDGKVYTNSCSIKAFDRSFGVGDVIGCGVNLGRKLVFFTINGAFLGIASEEVTGQVYPAVSLNSSITGLEISVNFEGSKEKPFKYIYSPTDINGTEQPLGSKSPGKSDGSAKDAATDDDWW
ncbi:hypothetical protein TWF718_003070 [Orbilia javanica]|uniref:B30.2/SPRY domain-containing protein n=1 Tax=Orbilia javanica TaxID=47235 RepID=A0AAN8R897_9PEZI